MKSEEFDKKLREILQTEAENLPEMTNKNAVLENIFSKHEKKRRIYYFYFVAAAAACALITIGLFSVKQKDTEPVFKPADKQEKLEIVQTEPGFNPENKNITEENIVSPAIKKTEKISTANRQPYKRKNVQKLEKLTNVNLELKQTVSNRESMINKFIAANTDTNTANTDEEIYIVIIDDSSPQTADNKRVKRQKKSPLRLKFTNFESGAGSANTGMLKINLN